MAAAKERWPAAQTVDQPDAQQRADNLFEQFADGGRNGLADAVIIPVQHAGCAENRDARQKTQQCGQGLNVAEPQAQWLAEEKCQCGNQQADGQRKQQRTAHDANPARAFRFGAPARDGDGQAVTTGVMSSICALCASSTRPIVCAPSSRESHNRSRKPTERTAKCDALKKSVF